MHKRKFLSYYYDRLIILALFIILLMTLPLMYLIPPNNIMTAMTKTNVMQRLNMSTKSSLLSLELLVCCLALFLCWSIIEIHRQRSNKIFDKLLSMASDAERINTQHGKEDILLRKSINLLEQTMEDYAMLLIMINKRPRESEDKNQINAHFSCENNVMEKVE